MKKLPKGLVDSLIEEFTDNIRQEIAEDLDLGFSHEMKMSKNLRIWLRTLITEVQRELSVTNSPE